MTSKERVLRNYTFQSVDRFTIDTVEGDAGPRHGHGAHQAIDTGVLGMRDGDGPANAGRAELFALEDRLDDVLAIGVLELPRGPQVFHHLADGRVLGGRLQFGIDGVADHEIGHAHAQSPFDRGRTEPRIPRCVE